MTYVYGCKNREHPRVEVVHGMLENPDIWCSECGKKMHRIPQVFRFYMDPREVLAEHLDKGFRKYKEDRRKAGTL